MTSMSEELIINMSTSCPLVQAHKWVNNVWIFTMECNETNMQGNQLHNWTVEEPINFKSAISMQ